MASLIPGFEYDIFISYRQKDNRHDGWVTEFVDNLKGELESTFKEEIGVYFDINPHDGLLETHSDVRFLYQLSQGLTVIQIHLPGLTNSYLLSKRLKWIGSD